MSLLSRTTPLARPDWYDAEGGPRIMLAEDDQAMRRVLTRALVRERYRVAALADGKTLLAAVLAMHARGDGPDLIISDVRMPAFSGLDLLEALEQNQVHIPVILISAFCDELTLRRAHELGASCVLSKPFEMDVLRSAALCVLAHP